MARFIRFSAALAVLFLSLSTGLLVGPGPAWGAATPWVDHGQSRIRLLAGDPPSGGTETLNLGLQFQLRPGWKIYWRSPGEAGYPPNVDWSGSHNLAGATLRWPVPLRFELFGLETFGYSKEVILPIDARPERPGEPVILQAKVNYLTCKEICIPLEASLNLILPGVAGGPGPDAALIDGYRALVPGNGVAVGLGIERAVLTGTLERPVLQVFARSETPFAAPDVLVEGPPGFVFGKPVVALGDGGRSALLRVAALTAPDDTVLEGKRLILTVTDGARGVEREVVARLSARTVSGTGQLLVILGFALLGGLILNLMPCVLPVLSIKLLSVVKQGGRSRGEVRASFLASAAGILASFLVLASGAVALKALGLTVGWGIQFQQPLFLAAMALLLSFFAYNLFGFFEVPLPAWAQGLAGDGGAAQGGGGGLLGHFLTGAFATLLATPCSAPFLGTALGFALARGAGEIYLIFSVLGLGLALPYLLVAALPGLVRRLPRPGHWMITLRRVLGLALAGTAVWLLSVLAAQVSLTAAFAVGALLLVLGLVLWLGPRLSLRGAAGPALVVLLAAVAVLLPALLPARVAPTVSAGTQAAGEEGWERLDLARIPSLIAEGKVVLVDVTADWCLTCQVNKKLVLDKDPVRARLDDDGVVTMRGDWTLPNDEIAQYLESFGRYGIPFDAVYGPAMPDGQALPELLSSGAVLEALERAEGG